MPESSYCSRDPEVNTRKSSNTDFPYTIEWTNCTPRNFAGTYKLAGGVLAVLGMRVSVVLSSFCGVVRSVMKMALSDLSVMRGGVGVAGFVARRGFAMVACCVFVMFGGFAMMLDG